MDIFHLTAWQTWLFVACITAILELLVLDSYYLLAVVLGALVAALAAWWEATSDIQWLAFILGTVAATLLLHKLRSPTKRDAADDISYMVGKQVQVVVEVNPRGRVVYKGVGWEAETTSNSPLPIGTIARIVRVHGSTLTVAKIEESV